jgi:hypothetical protein
VVDNVPFPRPFRACHGVVKIKKSDALDVEKQLKLMRCGTGNRECGESSDSGIACCPWPVYLRLGSTNVCFVKIKIFLFKLVCISYF